MAIKLSKDQEATVLQTLRDCNDLLHDISQVEDCDNDCSAHKLEVAKLVRKLEKYRQHFGSGVKT